MLRLTLRFLLLLVPVLAVVGCRSAFADRAHCAEDLHGYEDRVRAERDTIRQAMLIAAADSDAIRAGRGPQQRMVIHNLLLYAARSGRPSRGTRSAKMPQFICADSAQ